MTFARLRHCRASTGRLIRKRPKQHVSGHVAADAEISSPPSLMGPTRHFHASLTQVIVARVAFPKQCWFLVVPTVHYMSVSFHPSPFKCRHPFLDYPLLRGSDHAHHHKQARCHHNRPARRRRRATRRRRPSPISCAQGTRSPCPRRVASRPLRGGWTPMSSW